MGEMGGWAKKHTGAAGSAFFLCELLCEAPPEPSAGGGSEMPRICAYSSRRSQIATVSPSRFRFEAIKRIRASTAAWGGGGGVVGGG